MLENGFIKVFRGMKRWGWYKDNTTKALWLHLLLSVNYEMQMFMGREIARGQLVTSHQTLAEETGLSMQSVRTAIRHLKQTGEITVQATRHYSVITVVEFDVFQSDALTSEWQAPNKHLTNNWQTPNKPLTNSWQTPNKQLTTMEESKKARKQESKKAWSVPLPPDAREWFSDGLHLAVTDWLTYKHERREDYKPTGLRTLVAEIRRKAAERGDAAVVDVIRLSMANNWRGIIWDRLGDRPQQAAGSFADVRGDW